MPDTYTPSSDIAAIILIACFAVAFLLLMVGAVVKFFGRPKSPVTESAVGLEDCLPTLPAPPLFGKVMTWWCHRVDILGLLLLSLVFLAFALSQVAANKEKVVQVMSPSLLISNILIFVILVGVVTTIVAWRVKPVVWLGLRWRQWPHFFWIGPVAVFIMWIVLIALQISGYIQWLESLVGSNSTQDAVKLLREGKDPLTVGLMAFSAAIVAPLAEEVIFRGYIYPVAKHFAGPWIGVLFTSLVFAAGHGNVPLLLPLFLLAILLALAYEWTGSLWASISIHFFFNFATVALQIAARAGWLSDSPPMP